MCRLEVAGGELLCSLLRSWGRRASEGVGLRSPRGGLQVSEAPRVEPFDWSALSKAQLGRYGEYVVKMELARLGCDVYVPEVDDKGIDLLVRLAPGRYAEVQVKSVRGMFYTYMRKSSVPLDPSRFLALALFGQGRWPDVFLIPMSAWLHPNALFVDRDYEGRKSAPEWGLNLSAKTMPLLEPYRLAAQLERLMVGGVE